MSVLEKEILTVSEIVSKKTASGPKGPIALYNGFGVSVMGIIPYRGVYFGLYDSLSAKNPYNKSDSNFMRAGSKFLVA